MHRENVGRQLARVVVVLQVKEGMRARTRNTHLTAAIAFCNWCAGPNVRRLAANPFTRMPKANEKADPRRKRRSMIEAELVLALDVARRRPLLDARTVRRGKRKGETYAKLRDATSATLKKLDRERALMYKTLILTGLRQGEMGSLTDAQAILDGDAPYLALAAADEKNREGCDLPLRADLADDLRLWLAEKLRVACSEAVEAGKPVPSHPSPDTPLFDVPTKLIKIFNRDLKMAGIAKRDERGRTLDVHALRTTFGTLLSNGGVAPRTAQAAMRHHDIDLTMNVYTDPRMLDVAGAMIGAISAEHVVARTFSPDGRFLALVKLDPMPVMEMYEMPTLKFLWQTNWMVQREEVRFGPDSATISALSPEPPEVRPPELVCFDCATGKQRVRIPLPANMWGGPATVHMTPDRRRLLVHQNDGQAPFGQVPFWVRVLEWFPWLNAQRDLRNDTVVVFDTETCRERLRLSGRGTTLALLSDDGGTLVSMHDDGMLRCWDVDARKPMHLAIGVPAGLGMLIVLAAWWRRRRTAAEVAPRGPNAA